MLHIQTLVQPCHCIPPPPSTSSFAPTLFTTHSPHSATHSPSPLLITPFYSLLPRSPPIFSTFSSPRKTHRFAYSQDDVFDEFSSTQSVQRREADAIRSIEELELRNKPPLVSVDVDGSAPGSAEPQEEDEALAPFLRFFKGKESLDEVEERVTEAGPAAARDEESRVGSVVDDEEEKDGEVKKVGVEYYEPRPGDFVVGVVVSGNENRLDVNVGADLLGTMLTKEVLPLYDKEMDYLLCDLKDGAEHFMVRGKMGIIHYDDVVKGGPVPGRPVVDTGTVLFAEVLGRTLSGRPLLSTRRLFRRIAWHRVRQIKQLNEPIEVKITQWNTGGLLTRIEGLRAFLPKAELVNRANNYTELKQNVGRRIQVLITRIDEDKNDLILSEKEAWGMLHLQEGTLLDGTVKKILPYGAQVRIGDSNRSGLLHISKISATRLTSVSSVLKVDEKVKVLVVKSMFPDKISLSIVDLESEPGLFILNKERVFSEAEIMAKKYRQKLPVTRTTKFEDSPTNPVPFDSEASLYANWKWFKFEKEDE